MVGTGGTVATRSRDVRAGLACARAFHALAEPTIESSCAPAREGVYVSAPPEVGAVVAAATNLAFALELYLKSLLAVFDKDPRGHDLRVLYDALPQDVRGEINNRYDVVWRSKWNGRRASFTIAKGPPTAPAWNDYSKELKDIASLLDRSRECFSSWRYVFEWVVQPNMPYQLHEFEYGLLDSACLAMHDALLARL